MPRTSELVALLRTTDREFRRVHRKRGLTRRDKQELQKFYVDRVFAPEAARILRDAAPLRMLTAKDLEAWLKIDRKTIYAYVVQGLIPHASSRMSASANPKFAAGSISTGAPAFHRRAIPRVATNKRERRAHKDRHRAVF